MYNDQTLRDMTGYTTTKDVFRKVYVSFFFLKKRRRFGAATCKTKTKTKTTTTTTTTKKKIKNTHTQKECLLFVGEE